MQELIFTTRPITASEALKLHLVNHCVEEGNAMNMSLELARGIAQVRCDEQPIKGDPGPACLGLSPGSVHLSTINVQDCRFYITVIYSVAPTCP